MAEYATSTLMASYISSGYSLSQYARLLLINRVYNKIVKGYNRQGVLPIMDRTGRINHERGFIMGLIVLSSEDCAKKHNDFMTKEHKCEQCGKDMGFEYLLGAVCGSCCRKNHKKACHK